MFSLSPSPVDTFLYSLQYIFSYPGDCWFYLISHLSAFDENSDSMPALLAVDFSQINDS